MSLGSFFKNLWASIKKVFVKLPAQAKQAVELANHIVENIKNFVDSPGADVLAQIIPGNIDNAVLVFLRTFLPKLLVILAGVRQCLPGAQTLFDAPVENDELKKAVLTLKNTGNVDANKILRHGIAAVLTEKISSVKGVDIPWSESVAVTEHYHKNEIAA